MKRPFQYAMSVEVPAGAGHDTRTEVFDEGFIEAIDEEEARTQLALLVPHALSDAMTWLTDTALADLPTPDDVDIILEPIDIQTECEHTRRRIESCKEKGA
jgi:hypothetical protein